MKTVQPRYPALIMCPHCGSEWMHHSVVMVFNRNEDEEYTSVVSVAHSTADNTQANVVKLRNDEVHNPSPRRHGLRIALECETCQRQSTMDIYQHKGNTIAGWTDG